MPLLVCAFCHQGNRKRKVLKCLHAVCVACLSRCITYNGIVQCPNCKEETPAPLKSAISQFDALADCVVDEEEVRESNTAEAGVATCKDTCCDECFEETPAESKCVDCGAHFCPDHASVHPKSRAFYKHRLVDLPEQSSPARHSSSASSDSLYCPLHPTEQLESYCSCCRDLLCGTCLPAHNQDHEKYVRPVAEAAKEARKMIKGILGESVCDSDREAERALKSVNSAVHVLHDRTEATSFKISEYFQGVIALVKERESQVLDDLDKLRANRLLPLEKHQGRLYSFMASSAALLPFLNEKQPDSNFLKLESWLEESANREVSLLEEGMDPYHSRPVFDFSADSEADFKSCLSKLGRVKDNSVNVAKSSFSCAPVAQKDMEMIISVVVKDDAGCGKTAEEAEHADLKLEASCADNDVSTIIDTSAAETTTFNGQKSLLANFQPTTVGVHSLSATFNGRHLPGSPVLVDVKEVIEDDIFDPASCLTPVVLSNDNKTVQLASYCSLNVLGAKTYSSGSHTIRIRIEKPNQKNIHIGTTSASGKSALEQSSHAPGVHAWTDNQRNARGVGVASVFQTVSPASHWSSDEVLRLHLNFDNSTLTLTEESTGKQATSKIDGKPLRLFVRKTSSSVTGKVTII